MDKIIWRSFSIFSIFFLVFSACRTAEASIQSFRGFAVDASGTIKYIERHQTIYQNGRIIESQTTYFDQDNNKIGSLVSEYDDGPQWGSYQFEDLRAQYRDGVQVMSDHLKLFKFESPETPMESKIVPREANQVVGQGFNHFISMNLQQIADGKVFPVKLIMPSRLNQYSFRIRKQALIGSVLSVRIEIENPLLRLFAPHIDVDYDLLSGRLLRYEGVSNLASVHGKHEKVTIRYHYD